MNTLENFVLNFIQKIAAGILICTMVYACRTAEIPVNNSLKSDSEIYSVKGRQASQIGQRLSFGEFNTSTVKRGWTFGYSLPFIVRFNGASEKVSFSITDRTNIVTKVAMVSRFSETEITSLAEYFSISVNYKNYCAGSVLVTGSDTVWDFLVQQVDGARRNGGKEGTTGVIQNGPTTIRITGIRELEGSHKILTQNDVYGYEFSSNGRLIGAVSTINNGKVWFKNGLDPQLRRVLAGVSSALMLRNSVEDSALSMN